MQRSNDFSSKKNSSTFHEDFFTHDVLYEFGIFHALRTNCLSYELNTCCIHCECHKFPEIPSGKIMSIIVDPKSEICITQY